MEEKTALQLAQEQLAIEDVYVQSASAYADEAFDPLSGFGNPTIQFRIVDRGTCDVTECGPEDQRRTCARYVIDTGMRILKPGVEPSEELGRDQVFAEILATFVVRYLVMDPSTKLTEEQAAAFSENATFHLWPYWREFLHASAARLRLPAVVLPMRTPRGRTRKPAIEPDVVPQPEDK